MITPQSWELNGHNTSGRYFIGGSMAEVLQEASCWCAINNIEEIMGIQYAAFEDERSPDDMNHSLVIFYDKDI